MEIRQAMATTRSRSAETVAFLRAFVEEHKASGFVAAALARAGQGDATVAPTVATSRTLYSATVSLDGFIAGPGGDMQWLTEYLGPDPEAEALVDRIGALLVGARTFGGDDPNAGTDREGAFGGQWSGPQFVLTHRPPAEPVPDVTFLDDVERAVALARAAAAGKYVNVLGADVARQCLEAGLLDEVLVLVVPVLLGDGVPLFRRTDGDPVRLERLSVTTGPLAAHLWFRVVTD